MYKVVELSEAKLATIVIVPHLRDDKPAPHYGIVAASARDGTRSVYILGQKRFRQADWASGLISLGDTAIEPSVTTNDIQYFSGSDIGYLWLTDSAPQLILGFSSNLVRCLDLSTGIVDNFQISPDVVTPRWRLVRSRSGSSREILMEYDASAKAVDSGS